MQFAVAPSGLLLMTLDAVQLGLLEIFEHLSALNFLYRFNKAFQDLFDTMDSSFIGDSSFSSSWDPGILKVLARSFTSVSSKQLLKTCKV